MKQLLAWITAVEWRIMLMLSGSDGETVCD